MEGTSYRVSLLNAQGATSGGGGPAVGSGLVTIRDEGVEVGKASVLDFIGVDVRATIGPDGIARIFVPAPQLASVFNTNTGTTDARVGAVPVSSRLLGRGLRAGDWAPPLLQTGGNLATQVIREVTPTKTWTLATPGMFAVPTDPSRVTIEVLDENTPATILYTLTATLTGNKSATSGPLTLQITDYQPNAYQFAARATATIKSDQLTGVSGRFTLRFRHELVSGALLGQFVQTLFWDRDTPTVALNGGVSYALASPTLKKLSGVGFYTLGTKFSLAVAGLDATTTDSWPGDGVLLEANGDMLGLPALMVPGPDLTNWKNVAGSAGASYARGNWQVAAAGLFRKGVATVQARLYDYGAQSWKLSESRNVLLDTYADDATRVVERFHSETWRRTEAFGAWNSTDVLGAGQLQVIGGALRRPQNEDYGTYEPAGPNYTGLSAGGGVDYFIREYQSNGASKSNGVFVIKGLTSTQLQALVTLEISIDKTAWFSLNQGYNPSNGPLVNGSGCRVEPGNFDLTLNQRLKFTLGTLFASKVYLRIGLAADADTVELTECTLETWA